MKCVNCGLVFQPVDNRVGRRDACSKCGADLHACVQCEHHDPSAYNECRETQADRVQVKDRANFCDHFAIRPESAGSGPRPGSKEDLKAKAEALFGKKPSS